MGSNFAILTHLQTIGLIEFNTVGSFGFGPQKPPVTVSFFGQAYQLEHDNKQQDFDFGQVMLTAVGHELNRISHAIANDECRNAALEGWNVMGWRTVGAVADI
jgi:hypothetical protein